MRDRRLLGLLALRLRGRAATLRKCPGGGGPLNVSACVLLLCRWLAGAAVSLLRRTLFLWRRLPCLRRRGGCALRCLRLVVLLHYGVARLITIVLGLKY